MQSTGPKSPEGKAKVARNGWKGGKRPLLRSEMRQMRSMLKELNAFEQV